MRAVICVRALYVHQHLEPRRARVGIFHILAAPRIIVKHTLAAVIIKLARLIKLLKNILRAEIYAGLDIMLVVFVRRLECRLAKFYARPAAVFFDALNI